MYIKAHRVQHLMVNLAKATANFFSVKFAEHVKVQSKRLMIEYKSVYYIYQSHCYQTLGISENITLHWW